MKHISAKDGEWHSNPGYNKKILLNENELNAKNCLVQLIEIPPHTEVAPHYHKSCTEVFYITEGKGSFVINDQTIHLSVGDTLTCEPNEVHSTQNTYDTPFRYVVFKINVQEQDLYWV